MTAGIWRAHLPEVEGRRRCLAVAGSSHPDGADVDLVALEPDDLERVLVEAEYDAATGRVLALRPASLGGRPPALWFVRQPEPRAAPPAMVLVGFEGGGVPPGSVLGASELRDLPVAPEAQVGAVRWWPASGVVHQVYVQPQHRRRGVGRVLVQAAGGYGAARRWPPLRVDGARTELGQAALEHAPDSFGTRVAPRTAVAAPMTPPAQAAGVPRHHLEPDGAVTGADA